MNARFSTVKGWRLLSLLALVLGATLARAQPLLITNISCTVTGVSLHWTASVDRYILTQSHNLLTGRFDYVGEVLSTNTTSVTNPMAAAYFKVRDVAVVDFPDAALRTVVSNAIMTKFKPAEYIYDIDVSPITTLNAEGSGISNAVGLNECTGLTVLDVSSNALTALDVSGLDHLEELYCYANSITNLNLSGCTNLWALICMDNPLGALDVSGMDRLSWVFCYNDGLTNLDLNGCASLDVLICGNNPLSDLDVSGKNRLSRLDCPNSGLTNLNLSGCTNLALLACNDNLLTTVDVASCVGLTNLYCYNNRLATLDISSCTNLTLVQCISNNLTDVSSFITNAARGGLGMSNAVYLIGNPLSQYAITNQIPILESYGVAVFFW